MRKSWIIVPLALLALALLPLMYSHTTGEDTPTNTTIVLPTPTTAVLPMCTEEDGAGMALCWWDAKRQGNGMGTSVISGDCAPDIMGEASHVCVNLHARDSITIDNADGSSITIPNGADLIAECMSEYQQGIELQNCIRQWHNS